MHDFKTVLEEHLEMQQVKGPGLAGCQSTGGPCSPVAPCPALLGQVLGGDRYTEHSLHCSGQCWEGSPVCKANQVVA